MSSSPPFAASKSSASLSGGKAKEGSLGGRAMRRLVGTLRRPPRAVFATGAEEPADAADAFGGFAASKDDAKFVRRFGLEPGEVVTSKAACQLVAGRRKMYGKLYLSKNYACFSARLFGSEHKRVFPWIQCR